MLITWTGTDRQLHQIFMETNNINSNIKFTLENESTIISYLDLIILYLNQKQEIRLQYLQAPNAYTLNNIRSQLKITHRAVDTLSNNGRTGEKLK